MSVAIVYPLLFIFSIVFSQKMDLSFENAIAIGFGITAKNHGIALTLAISFFGGLAVLPPSIVPMLQVLLMMGIWKLSPKIRKYFERRDY